ncbi:hypothetical protein BU16DRAFT_471065 [Lophium mytilinum]|uniref:Uncharacterized protein n=1 Tax=Lophium mytilinum TaxID=390894 RepID=A0A6A6QEJ6_9PEZI|nr:hypothetical protein BU16DRAFT_471065 [Lophium mytilinum]
MSLDTSPEQDALVNDVSKQMAASQLTRRYSRSSGSQSGRRPARVEKPRSNHNSPRTLERRKTTSGTKRYATLDDHYNMMFGVAGGEEGAVEDRREPSRPLSWHPSSTHPQGQSRSSMPVPHHGQVDPAPFQSALSRNSGFESEFDSISARSSAYQDSNPRFSSTAQTESSWQEARQQTSAATYNSNTHTDGRAGPTPWYLQNWAKMVQAQAQRSRPSSMEFLPIQHPSAPTYGQNQSAFDDDESEEEDGDGDLVGMGLYDPPEGIQTWQTSTLRQGTGKGLKLEETWQPPEQVEDGDDASSDDGSVDEPLVKDEDHWSLKANEVVPANMDGKSFFFDDEETYTKEPWFQQVKQPTVQDTGLGYGWL